MLGSAGRVLPPQLAGRLTTKAGVKDRWGGYKSTIKGRCLHLPPAPGLGLGWGRQIKLLDRVRFKVRSKWMLHVGSPSEVTVLFRLYP